MPAHLSIGTALDKNLVGSNVVYLVLLEVDIINPNDGSVLQTLNIVQNNENFTWNGQVYTAMQFDIEMIQDSQSAPTCNLTVYDIYQLFQAQLQAYGWQLAWPVRVKIINASNPLPMPEIEQDFTILSAQCKEDKYQIDFTIGAQNPLTLMFPPRQQFRDRCFWIYRDASCRYAGAIPTCDLGYDTPNGCLAHSDSTSVASISRTNNIVTVVMQKPPSVPYSLGTMILVTGVTVDASMNTEGSAILSIPSAASFTYRSVGNNVNATAQNAATCRDSHGNASNYGGFIGLHQTNGKGS